jgi:hypothetical protein
VEASGVVLNVKIEVICEGIIEPMANACSNTDNSRQMQASTATRRRLSIQRRARLCETRLLFLVSYRARPCSC